MSITASSTPKYDVPGFPFDEAWGCADWMTWHKKLKEKFGQERANKKFVKAWNKQGYFEWNYSFCKYNSDFEAYFKNQGLDPGNFVSQTVNNVKDTAVNASQAASNLTGGLVSNTVIKVVLILIVVLAGYGFLNS